jgi:peptidyl-prolyl cis-trans isomerase C
MRMRALVSVIAAVGIVAAAEAGTALKVNGTEISSGQLAVAKYWVTYNTPSLEGNDAEVTRRAVNELVKNVLLADAARAAGVKLGAKDVQKGLESIKAQIGGRAVYDDLLKKLGATDAEVLQQAERQQLGRRYVTEKIEPGVTVSEAEVRAWYDAHKQDIQHPAQIKVRVILVNAPPGADASAEKSARKKIDEAERRILAGEDFAKVARDVSDDMSKANGGELGWVGRGILPAEAEARIWALEPGELSAVERGRFAFGLFEMLDKRAAGPFAYEEIRGDLEKAARETKVKDATTAAIAKQRGAAKIEALDPAVKAALQ